MKIPLSWIREFVPVELPPAELAHRLTMAGVEVEDIEVLGQDWERILVGRVASLEPHPAQPYLSVVRVELGAEALALVTAATNLRHGDLVPVALPGARVGGRAVEAREFAGVRSQGMLLSADELGVGTERDGIYLLEGDARPGQALREVLGDVLFDFKITPNRPDLMNVLGIAREVAALTGLPLARPPLEPLEGGPPASALISVEIPAPDLCLRYTAAVVLGVSVGPSPPWLRRRLHLSGVRPISNVVDVTNYVMLELGQPLHGFDLALLHGGLVIRRARQGERIRTLDGQERELTAEMLVIADHRQAQALAGVMGGLDSEVGDKTRDVVIESANFEPMNIRRTSRALRLSTEASRRFERGLDPDQTAPAAQRAANLMVRLAGGTAAGGLVDVYPRPLPRRRLFLTPGYVSSFLGKGYSLDEIERVLLSLEFTLERRDGGLDVVVPGHRRDVEGLPDLAEEVARITGYELIPDTLPAGRLPEPRPNPSREWEMLARRVMVGCGLQEVITYSLVAPSAQARLDSRAAWPPAGAELQGPSAEFREDPTGGSAPDTRNPELEAPLRVFNPMSVEQSVLRTSLLPSLLETVRANLRHHERVAIFELARVYLPPLDPLPTEARRLGITLVGPRYPSSWTRDGGLFDFFDLKGMVERLLASLGIARVAFRAGEHPTFHPGRVAQLLIARDGQPEQPVGYLGQVHPVVAERFDVERKEVYAAELDFEALAAAARDVERIRPLPRFPGVEVDLALVVDEAISHQAVREVILAAGGPLLDHVELFDVYRGAPLPAGTRSLAYSLTFRSPERTLTDEEVAGFQAQIERALAERLGATIRGRS